MVKAADVLKVRLYSEGSFGSNGESRFTSSPWPFVSKHTNTKRVKSFFCSSEIANQTVFPVTTILRLRLIQHLNEHEFKINPAPLPLIHMGKLYISTFKKNGQGTVSKTRYRIILQLSNVTHSLDTDMVLLIPVQSSNYM